MSNRIEKYWVITASRDHVKNGIAGGFAQACHGKSGLLNRMQPGDFVIYYSGKEYYGQEAKCQKFTALGRVPKGDPYQVEMTPGFCPFRIDLDFMDKKNNLFCL